MSAAKICKVELALAVIGHSREAEELALLPIQWFRKPQLLPHRSYRHKSVVFGVEEPVELV